MRKLAVLVALGLLLVPVTSVSAQAPVTVSMTASGGSGVTGSAVLTPQGSQTQVVVTIQGAPPNGTHVNHIHNGTCAQQGGIAFPLADLKVDANGRATATSTVNATLASLQGGANYVNAHAGAALPSPGISCGDIPRAGAAAPAAPAAPAAQPAAPAAQPAAPAAQPARPPAQAAPAAQPARPPAQLPRTGEADSLLPLAALGFALVVGGGLLVARRRRA